MKLKLFFETQKLNIKFELKQDLEHLITEILSLKKIDLFSENYVLSKKQISNLEKYIEDLKIGKPLSYILKSQEFMGLNFFVDERVLIPRPETEFLVDLTIKRNILNNLVLFDAGAGSGCIGISILVHIKNSFCIFMESSKEAIEVLKQNLSLQKIDKNRFVIVNSFEDFEAQCAENQKNIDLFISNPPYIKNLDPRVEDSVLNYEPAKALYADDNGLFFLKLWSVKSFRYLKDGGYAIFEFGLGQDKDLIHFSNQMGFKYEILKDQYKCSRFWKINISSK